VDGTIRAEAPTDRFVRAWVLWAAAFLWWTLSGLVNLVNLSYAVTARGGHFDWAHQLASQAVGDYTWVPLTVGTFWLARVAPIEPGNLARGLWLHAVAGVMVVLSRAVLIFYASAWLGWFPKPSSFGTAMVYAGNNLFKFSMFVGVAHALHYARRSRQRELTTSRLEALLARAELDALRARLQPHFLFNALSSLTELVHRDADAAEQGILRLAALLRRTLDAAEPEVLLDDELAFVSNYLEIERLRLGPRLSVAWDIEAPVRRARVPHLVLQPLVENAVRHGLAPRTSPGRVRIAARAEADQLILEVEDDGVGLDARSAAGSAGLGLASTRDRLFRLYGARQCLDLTSRPGGGTLAAARLPLRYAAQSVGA
jgi:signal transduction histidine kinase